MKKDLKDKGYQVTSPGMTPGPEERKSLKHIRSDRYKLDTEREINIGEIETEIEEKDIPPELLRR